MRPVSLAASRLARLPLGPLGAHRPPARHLKPRGRFTSRSLCFPANGTVGSSRGGPSGRFLDVWVHREQGRGPPAPPRPHDVSETPGTLHLVTDVIGEETASAPFLRDVTPCVHQRKRVTVTDKGTSRGRDRPFGTSRRLVTHVGATPLVSPVWRDLESLFSSAFKNASKSRACPSR